MSVTFPTSVPAYPDTTGGEVLGAAAAGRGLSRILDDYGLDISAIATKLGTGASTPTAGKVLRSTSTGVSVWGAIDLTADISGLPASMAAWLLDPTSAKLRTAVSDETGTGSLVFGTSPTLVTPVIASFVTAQHTHGNTAGGGPAADWYDLNDAPDSVVYNGNRSYNLFYTGVNLTSLISRGMRLRLTRTVAAPTQCTTLNGSSNYWNKTSPAGMTFTDDPMLMAHIKLTAYSTTDQVIASRYNGTSGWELFIVGGTGQLALRGYNAGAGNLSQVVSVQSVPLNKWTHVAIQLDMSSFTVSTSTSYVMFDGTIVGATVARTGSSPTALIQAGNLEIGSSNGGTKLFAGKIAQLAIFNTKVSFATTRGYFSQAFIGSETSLISAYSFSGTSNDLNTGNANNLTSQGSASANFNDAPFGNQSNPLNFPVLANTDYAVVTLCAYGGDTSIAVQVPEGCTIPTTGGLSGSAYSSVARPLNMPTEPAKYNIEAIFRASSGNISIGAITTWYAATDYKLDVPAGPWELEHEGTYQFSSTIAGNRVGYVTLAATAPPSFLTNDSFLALLYAESHAAALETIHRQKDLQPEIATTYTVYYSILSATGAESFVVRGDAGEVVIRAKNPYV